MGLGSGERANTISPRPISSWLCDTLCFGAALWTICCHAVVAFGGSLWDLFAVVAIALIAAVIAAFGLRDRLPSTHLSQPEPATGPAKDPFPRVARVAGAAFGIAAVVASSLAENTLAVWWSCVTTLGFALAIMLWRCPQPLPDPSAASGRGREIALWGLALACAALALAYRRTGLDIPFYLSLAIAAADAPGEPLMRDTIHGVAGLGLHMPAHRVHSFEVFNGAMSLISGWPVIAVYQLGIAAVSAALVPVAFARLFRILTPTHWPWAVIGVLAVLIGGGGALSWYGNLSIVRIFHGKSVYMSVLLPLVYAYGLRYGAHPTAARWFRLCAAQIASVGLTSSALWSAPIAAGLAVVCAVQWDRRVWRTLALAGLSSSYLVALGWSLSIDLAPIAATISAGGPPGTQLEAALARTIGGGRLEVAVFAAAAAAWAFQRRGAARRFAIVVPFVILILVLNPYWSDAVRRYLTGPSYWRAMWSFPVPILLALLLTAPLGWQGNPTLRRMGAAIAAAAVWSFVALVPTYSSISTQNQAGPGRIVVGLTVPFRYYAAASAVNSLAPAGSMVVAPQKVALWVIGFHKHPYVTYAREVYLRRIKADRGERETDLRMMMSEVVSVDSDIEQRIRNSPGFARRAANPHAVRVFRSGLRQFGVRTVCVNQRARLAERVYRVLRETGFTRRAEVAGYTIWTRST